jgi:hypothetical protein
MAAVIEGPIPAPPRLSLLDAADLPNDPLEVWANPNVQWWPRSCSGSSAYVFNPCDTGTKPAGERVELQELKPFGIGFSFECSSLGGLTPAQYRTRAREEFEAWEPKLIEQQVWNATAISTNPDLEAAGVVISGGGLDPVPALGCLLQEMRGCGHGGPGLIHATPRLVNEWTTNGSVVRANRWKGDLVYTITDDVVIPGSGYDGSPPAAAAPGAGVQWAYATRLVQIRRSPVTFFPGADLSEQQWMREAMNRTVNTVRVLVERAVLAAWDPCCVIAVPVTLADCPST